MTDNLPVPADLSCVTMVPGTGELFDLAVPDEAGRALAAIDLIKRQVDDARQTVVDMLWEEGERRGTKTLHLETVTVELAGGSRVEWDVEKLADRLLDAGLPKDRVADLIKTTVTYKVDGNVARQLQGANAAYAEAIAACKETIPTTRRARIK